MSDNVLIPGLSATVATDDDGTAQHQSIKVMAGNNGTFRRWLPFESTPFHLISAATINATVVKASEGWLCYIMASNVNAAVRYLKFYDKATTPAPASDSALLKLVVALPVTSTNPVMMDFGDNSIHFASGIAIVCVTGISDTDATAVAASEQNINLGYC